MKKTFTVIALILALSLPNVVIADEPLVLVQQQMELPAGNEVDPAHVLAVGAGVVVGALAFSSVLNFQGAGIVGAVAGGLVTDWWYGERYDYAELERK
jgi:hypothetical protein